MWRGAVGSADRLHLDGAVVGGVGVAGEQADLAQVGQHLRQGRRERGVARAVRRQVVSANDLSSAVVGVETGQQQRRVLGGRVEQQPAVRTHDRLTGHPRPEAVDQAAAAVGEAFQEPGMLGHPGLEPHGSRRRGGAGLLLEGGWEGLVGGVAEQPRHHREPAPGPAARPRSRSPRRARPRSPRPRRWPRPPGRWSRRRSPSRG